MAGDALSVVDVVVGLASAFECDLVLGKLAAFLHRRSLGLGIGPRFRRRVRDLLGVGRMNVVDWSDHLSGLLSDGSAVGEEALGN